MNKDTVSQVFPQLRVLSPGVTLFSFLLALTLLKFSQEKKTIESAIGAGISFSLLFYTYFYYWTAYSLILLMCIIFNSQNKRNYLLTATIGFFLGAPSIINMYLFKNEYKSDWLERTDHFLPIDNFSEFHIHKAGIVILFISFYWIFLLKNKKYHLIWFTLFSGIFLANHQVVTGLQIQNFHYSHVRSVATTLLLLIFIYYFIYRKKPKLFIILNIILIFSGFSLRYFEVTKNKTTIQINKNYQKFKKLKTPKLKERYTIAGMIEVQELLSFSQNLFPLENYMTVLSPSITNENWHIRHALHYFILGHTFEEYEKLVKEQFKTMYWGPWKRKKIQEEIFFKARFKAYLQIIKNPDTYIKKLKIKYIALNPNRSPLPYCQTKKIFSSIEFDLWDCGLP